MFSRLFGAVLFALGVSSLLCVAWSSNGLAQETAVQATKSTSDILAERILKIANQESGLATTDSDRVLSFYLNTLAPKGNAENFLSISKDFEAVEELAYQNEWVKAIKAALGLRAKIDGQAVRVYSIKVVNNPEPGFVNQHIAPDSVIQFRLVVDDIVMDKSVRSMATTGNIKFQRGTKVFGVKAAILNENIVAIELDVLMTKDLEKIAVNLPNFLRKPKTLEFVEAQLADQEKMGLVFDASFLDRIVGEEISEENIDRVDADLENLILGLQNITKPKGKRYFKAKHIKSLKRVKNTLLNQERAILGFVEESPIQATNFDLIEI